MGLHDLSDAKFHGESDIALQNDIGPFGGGDIKAQRYTEFCILGGHRVDIRTIFPRNFRVILFRLQSFLTVFFNTQIGKSCIGRRNSANGFLRFQNSLDGEIPSSSLTFARSIVISWTSIY